MRISQWNQLFAAVTAEGFSPQVDIIREEIPGEVLGYLERYVPALVHTSTRFFFAITELPPPPYGEIGGRPYGPFGIAYSPGRQTPRENQQWVSWDALLTACLGWLRRVREDSGPDLWEVAADDRSLFAPVSSADALHNTPFSLEERQRIAPSLDQIYSETVRTQQLSEAQADALRGALGHLQESMERLGRKDWLLLLYGSLVGVVIQAAFAPEQARNLWHLAGQVLGWLLHRAPLLP